MNVEGTIERVDFGPGSWALKADSGETFELKNAPDRLQQAGLRVRVEGRVRDDVMTFAAIGPVLEVANFEAI
jgi:hypothetical protein